MKNLAGVQSCDDDIILELKEADVKIITIDPNKNESTEVPYSIIGKKGNFVFTRAWNYWIARADIGKGLSIEVASKLHEKKNGQYIFGDEIRVAGHCGAPHPKDDNHIWADGETINVYHIDTQLGFNEFSKIL